MNTTTKIVRYELRDVLRSRALIVYALFFFGLTDVLLRFGGGGARAALSLMNVVLLLIPLVAIVFGTIYLYNAREFTELLLAQPVHRRQLFAGQYLGLALSLSAAFVTGLGSALALHAGDDVDHLATLVVVAASGILLTLIFTAFATLIVARVDDKVKGIGIAIGLWLAGTVLYDGLVMLGLMVFADYPLERPALAAMIANPIDLARVLILMRLDVSALMGYTGAVFEKFFGSAGGTALASLALVLWTGVPLLLGARRFQRKDF
ncbi:MAG TPA: ABC transporter permease subunit [Gemmatimonadaceae bacterium]|jgi:Cu-processing system permease protein